MFVNQIQADFTGGPEVRQDVHQLLAGLHVEYVVLGVLQDHLGLVDDRTVAVLALLQVEAVHDEFWKGDGFNLVMVRHDVSSGPGGHFGCFVRFVAVEKPRGSRRSR